MRLIAEVLLTEVEAHEQGDHGYRQGGTAHFMEFNEYGFY